MQDARPNQAHNAKAQCGGTCRAEVRVGVAFLVLALVVLGVWIPLDTETGWVEMLRRRLVIGDALAPSLAAMLVGLGGLFVIANALFMPEKAPAQFGWTQLAYLLWCLGLSLVSFALMRWVGPVALALAGEAASYRDLRDSLPWKYLGFVAGGFVLILTSVVAVERRLSLAALALALFAPLAIAMVYDLPFEDLLLPPNGDL